ncbi:hypothetical protein K7432_015629 [Basidiobolus ranarum]|uniref:O-fucosyltransferase family protein n=1 Tax=Basidiobolus ranarum TaxID=34480 RepID=A0ABR2WFW9_9FUNG
MHSLLSVSTITNALQDWKNRFENLFFTYEWILLGSEDQPCTAKRRRTPKLIFYVFCTIGICGVIGLIYFLSTLRDFNPEDWVPDPNPLTGKPWYSSKEVLEFRSSYPPPEYSLATPSLTYMLQRCTSGFGSYVNNLFNLFLIALDHNISFHIISLDWCYESWSTFFEDYSSGSSAPISLGQYRGPHRWWHSSEWKYTNISSPDFHGYLTVQHWGKNFQEFYHKQIHTIKGPIFERKQILAQALWEPKPIIVDAVISVRQLYVEKANRVLISMHIRRGDKLDDEMEDIPLYLYYTKVVDLSTNKYPGRDIALFVFSDDDKSVSELRALLAAYSHIHVFILSDAFSRYPSIAKDWTPLVQRQGYDQDKFREADTDYKYRQTAELITDMTLAATADEFICTYSSNIGRLVTLLRTKPIDTVHSLDLDQWYHD